MYPTYNINGIWYRFCLNGKESESTVTPGIKQLGMRSSYKYLNNREIF